MVDQMVVDMRRSLAIPFVGDRRLNVRPPMGMTGRRGGERPDGDCEDERSGKSEAGSGAHRGSRLAVVLDRGVVPCPAGGATCHQAGLDPSWRFISEYAIGDSGWIMVLAFVSLAVSCGALFIAIRSEIGTRGGKVGLAFLLAAAVGLLVAATFTTDPTTASGDEATTHGAIHGAGAIVGMMSIPVAAALLTRSLQRNPSWSVARRSLLWATGFVWIGFFAFEASFAIMLPGHELGPDFRIGWPNRFLILTYSVWLAAVALGAARLARPTTISSKGARVLP